MFIYRLCVYCVVVLIGCLNYELHYHHATNHASFPSAYTFLILIIISFPLAESILPRNSNSRRHVDHICWWLDFAKICESLVVQKIFN